MGRTALVTGASSGIGRSTAIALTKAGWNVVITARRQDALQETLDMCENPKEQCRFYAGDVTDEAFVRSLFDNVVEEFGRLDLLFNNAGMNTPQVDIEEISLEAFQQVMAVNVTGPFLCTREAFRVFRSQTPQGGRIINNGSLSAHSPRPHSYPYTCSKHAITGLTRTTALDGRKYNISCTQIDIGNALTELSARLQKGALQPNGELVSEAMIDVEHVASTIVHIASLPNEVMVLEMVIMPTQAPFVGRG